MCRKSKISITWVLQLREIDIATGSIGQATDWMESVKVNEGILYGRRLVGTSKDQGCDIKGSCDADDGVWTRDSNDDRDTRVAEMKLLKFPQGVAREDTDYE